MFDIEPYYNWRDEYLSEEDEYSPFYGIEYSEFDFENSIYNYYIHPQWDNFGSETLYMKILYANYEQGYAIFEMMGEWNDCISNDIMLLKRDVIDVMISNGISKYILIGENILNIHFDGDDYYQEWFEEVEDGWIAAVNLLSHVQDEFENYNIDQYVVTGGLLNELNWRTYRPQIVYKLIENTINKRLKIPDDPGRDD